MLICDDVPSFGEEQLCYLVVLFGRVKLGNFEQGLNILLRLSGPAVLANAECPIH